MKQLTLLLIMLFFTSMLIAQDFQGKAYYQSQRITDETRFNWENLTEIEKDKLKNKINRIDKLFERTYVLTFNKIASVYKEEDKISPPNTNDIRYGGYKSSKVNLYKNIKTQQLIEEQEFLGKRFLIKDTLTQLNWVREKETKQIGEYLCYKATSLKTDITSIIGVNKDKKNKESIKKITAWYTPQIPINQGPSEYWGLPGLILEINLDGTTISCTKIIMNLEENEVLKIPNKGEEVNEQEYNDIVKKKMEEISTGGGGGGINVRRN